MFRRILPFALPALAFAADLPPAPMADSAESSGVPRAAAPSAYAVRPVTEELAKLHGLDPFYRKCVPVHGFLVTGSDKVIDQALSEAAYLVDKMVGGRPDILQALVRKKIHLAVMACAEMTTDLPEERTLQPKDFWDVRARGLGAMLERPAVSCGEENLLNLEGDPYRKENLLIHEFSHAIHEIALNEIDPGFDQRLRSAFRRAKAAGLWKNTYSMQHYREYWAEAVQAWFDCAATNDLEHGPVGTREQLKAYDPGIRALLVEVFGDQPWRYTRASTRFGRDHLAGFDPKTAPRFSWRKGLKTIDQLGPMLLWMPLEDLPAKPPAAHPDEPSVVNFINRRPYPVIARRITGDADSAGESVEIPYGSIREITSFRGATWHIYERGRVIGGTLLQGRIGRLEIR